MEKITETQSTDSEKVKAQEERKHNMFQAMDLLEGMGYEDLKYLRSGTYGDVMEMYSRETNTRKVAKIVLRQDVTEKELTIAKTLRHVNVLPTEDILTMENGGVIMLMPFKFKALDQLIDDPRFIYCESGFSFVKTWLLDVTRGLKYLHEIGVCHLDLKVDNVLVDVSGTASICDFTFVNYTSHPVSGILVGLPLWTRPPELLNEAFQETEFDGVSFDLWSLGALAVVCFTKTLLFEKEYFWGKKDSLLQQCLDDGRAFSLLMKQSFPFYMFEEDELSVAIDFVKSLMHFEPKERLTAKEAMRHSFFNKSKSLVDLGDIFEEDELFPNDLVDFKATQ